jgi:hypothetical protein
VIQLVRQLEALARQAKRLPGSIINRYRVPEVLWRTHGAFPYAAPILTGLNVGDADGSLYRQAVDRLEAIDDILARLPAALRDRLEAQYATIELSDSVAQMAIHQAGAIRVNGPETLAAIQAMEDDAVSGLDDFHTQTALLNKINGASVLGLRIAEQSTQFLMHTLEQLLVDNKRTREGEVRLMNATIHQWRYGQPYGADLFRNTTSNLDTWRQY